MTPVVFGGCFGWIHDAPGSKGVVMCSPLGFEELGTHRSWRDLAERISQQGRPTLRFDYYGINDSLGKEENTNLVDTWINNIVEAVNFLKNTCGVSEVCLLGLRFGATLATLASNKILDITDLVLMAPVVTGRGYVRELRLIADAWWAAASPTSKKEHNVGHLDVIGTRFYTPTLDSFNAIDLRKHATTSLKRVLLLDPGDRPDIIRLADQFKKHNVDTDHYRFDGLDDFLRDSVLTLPPTEAFNKICSWLGDGGEKQLTPKHLIQTVKIVSQDYKEVTVNLGANRLFGILTEPIDPSSKYPSVLILNTGPNHHVGNGRLSVTLARHLAVLGVTTLRFDLAGIGDSDVIEGRGSALYSLDAMTDVREAVDLLEPLSNGHGTVVIGLCSGAFLGFHAAMLEPRITGAIIVNLQRFIWKEGTSLQVGGKRTKKSMKFYLRASMRRATWVRISKGQGDILDTFLTLSTRPFRKMFHNLNTRSQNGGETSTSKVRRWMKSLADQNVHIRFWYSDDDPGLSELEQYLGSAGKYTFEMKNVEIAILDGADHSLNSYAARMQFIAMFEAYLRECFNKTSPPETPL